jgi:hypothetical protein
MKQEFEGQTKAQRQGGLRDYFIVWDETKDVGIS